MMRRGLALLLELLDLSLPLFDGLLLLALGGCEAGDGGIGNRLG